MTEVEMAKLLGVEYGKASRALDIQLMSEIFNQAEQAGFYLTDYGSAFTYLPQKKEARKSRRERFYRWLEGKVSEVNLLVLEPADPKKYLAGQAINLKITPLALLQLIDAENPKEFKIIPCEHIGKGEILFREYGSIQADLITNVLIDFADEEFQFHLSAGVCRLNT